MTTTTRHALPWTFRRVLADMLTPRPRRIESLPELMTGREAAARIIYGEQVQWSVLDMLNYDNSPYLRGGWEAEADRRLNTPTLSVIDLRIARWYGYTPAQWTNLPAIVKADKRENFFQVAGL